MPGASTSGAPGETARQGGPSRLRNALLFVVIAWSIAGAFQLLFWAGPWLVDRGVKAGWMPDGIVKPRPVQTVDCTAAVQGMPQRELDDATRNRARVAAYELGFNLGLVTGARNAGAGDAADGASTREERDRLARELALPRPGIPPLRQLVDALHEFEVYMIADPECIGARLERGYSREHDALYRFGAFVGHSLAYRGATPQLGPLFVADLRRYGQAAGLPEDVWRPLLEASSRRPGQEAWAEAATIAKNILAYLEAEAAAGDPLRR